MLQRLPKHSPGVQDSGRPDRWHAIGLRRRDVESFPESTKARIDTLWRHQLAQPIPLIVPERPRRDEVHRDRVGDVQVQLIRGDTLIVDGTEIDVA